MTACFTERRRRAATVLALTISLALGAAAAGAQQVGPPTTLGPPLPLGPAAPPPPAPAPAIAPPVDAPVDDATKAAVTSTVVVNPLDASGAEVESVIVGQFRVVPQRLLRGLQLFLLPGIAEVRGDRQQLALFDSRAERLRMVGETGVKLPRLCRGFSGRLRGS